MFGSPAPTPSVPAIPDPLPSAPTYASGGGAKPTGKKPGEFGGTLMTSGEGAWGGETNVARKSLLGQ